MKLSVFAVAAGLLALNVCSQLAWAQETYDTKYDNINLDEILKNERLFKNYILCLTGKGKCTPDGKELKDHLPDALLTGCTKCSQKQKAGSRKVLKFMIENKPEDYKALEKLYDPDGIYKKKYEADYEMLDKKTH